MRKKITFIHEYDTSALSGTMGEKTMAKCLSKVLSNLDVSYKEILVDGAGNFFNNLSSTFADNPYSLDEVDSILKNSDHILYSSLTQKYLGKIFNHNNTLKKNSYQICMWGGMSGSPSPHQQHEEFITDPKNVLVSQEAMSSGTEKNNYNIFLGFYVDDIVENKEKIEREPIVVLGSKYTTTYPKNFESYVDFILEKGYKIYNTSHESFGESIDSKLENLGLIPRENFMDLIKRSKLFLYYNGPICSFAAVEACQYTRVFSLPGIHPTLELNDCVVQYSNLEEFKNRFNEYENIEYIYNGKMDHYKKEPYINRVKQIFNL